MILDKELKYFNEHKDELLKHYETQFVLIKDDEFIGAFTTEAEAYAAGIQKFGNQPFLIKKVTKEEELVHALDPTLMEEIQRTLEMMKRVSMARAAQAETVLPQGNTYVLPEPMLLRISSSA